MRDIRNTRLGAWIRAGTGAGPGSIRTRTREPQHLYKWDQSTEKAQRKKYRSSPALEIELGNLFYVRTPYEPRWSQFRGLPFAGDEATTSPNPNLLAHAR